MQLHIALGRRPRSNFGPSVAQTWRMSRPFRPHRTFTPGPIDAARLDSLALTYVARYATTRAKLAAYLERKIAQRGWGGEGEIPVEAIVERFAEMGYVNDAIFAAGRGAALSRRGYGERRVGDALRAAGIAEEDAAPVREAARSEALEAALIFARRRRIGPFAREDGDPDTRRRALAAMLRAGHPMDIARKVAFAQTGASLDEA